MGPACARSALGPTCARSALWLASALGVLCVSSGALAQAPAPKPSAATSSAATSSAAASGAAPDKPASDKPAPDKPAAPEKAASEGTAVPAGTAVSESAAAAPADPKHPPAREVLPPLHPNAQDDYVVSNDPPRAPSRKVELAFLFGSVIRPSGQDAIHYETGYFLGGSARVELAPWMGVRLLYREEHVPVLVQPGGFDYGTTLPFDFTQPDLEIVTIGMRVEPTWVLHPRFRLFGVLGAGWVRMDAPVPTAPGFQMEGKRSATEVNMPIGVGVAYEILPNWVNCTMSFTYGVAFDQHGRAYEPLQAVVDGKIVYLAPLPVLQSVGDLMFSLGVIL
ncbi:MAG TPA: hypothetical protein VLC09_10200 [Polyangiaceae bacterium]|nr:hypothetical protein [Polyangiaceae bacterium]